MTDCSLARSCSSSYRLFRIWQQHNTTYKEVYKSLTVFSVLALALLAATVLMSIRCLLNFGKGLKGAMARSDEEKRRRKTEEPTVPVISSPYHVDSAGKPRYPLPQRMQYGSPQNQAIALHSAGSDGKIFSPPRSAVAGANDYFDVYGGGSAGGMQHGRSGGGGSGSISTNALLATSPGPAISPSSGPGMYHLQSASQLHLDRYDSRQNNANRLSLD